MIRHDVRVPTFPQKQMYQPASTLLQTPLEIRHAIFSHVLPAEVHVHLDVNRINMSVCLAPEKEKLSTCYTYISNCKKHDGFCHPRFELYIACA